MCQLYLSEGCGQSERTCLVAYQLGRHCSCYSSHSFPHKSLKNLLVLFFSELKICRSNFFLVDTLLILDLQVAGARKCMLTREGPDFKLSKGCLLHDYL